jgi:hypothetical protein
MKLDDILNQSVNESSFYKMKLCTKAIKQIQAKAVDMGVLKANKKQYFSYLEGAEEDIDKSLL